MIKLKDILTEATIACGECLSYAWKRQSERLANNDIGNE
jgi:hypothetical protein